ncbi:hypothetical protein [Actinokineospora globicatena]|nr:hypothetical protein [Actinokineospora globicatena]GLW82506.1 hypothetical protein Aglo02_01470 [Actinokineospora globicatena]
MVLAVDTETLREIGYAELAKSYSASDTATQRAEVVSRRSRAAARWADDT